MTAKEKLRAAVDELSEADAADILDYLTEPTTVTQPGATVTQPGTTVTATTSASAPPPPPPPSVWNETPGG